MDTNVPTRNKGHFSFFWGSTKKERVYANARLAHAIRATGAPTATHERRARVTNATANYDTSSPYMDMEHLHGTGKSCDTHARTHATMRRVDEVA